MTMKSIAGRKRSDVERVPLWIDVRGNSHIVTEMETSHLFYSITMLWNNTMPLKTRNRYRTWELHSPRFQSKEYLTGIIRHMWVTLDTRRDLNGFQRMELDQITNYYAQIHGVKLLK